MFRGFNGMNNHVQEDFAKAREVCVEHPGCTNCSMTDQKPLEIEDRKVYCETGKNKNMQEGE